MSEDPMMMAIVGCGDFLRWQADSIRNSKQLAVTRLYDPAPERARRYADQLGGSAAAAAEDIFADPEIPLVALFVPPWLRRDYVERAVRSGKHIITTKPLAPNPAEARGIRDLIADSDGLRMGVIYNRTGNGAVETLSRVLEEGSFGKLALFKMDWLHHYPQWNTWALDPEKNGGPFMDAMIHNLNIARYLMNRPVERAAMVSQRLAHPDLSCSDTERLTLQFAGGGLADLFITWAADLAVYGTEGNDREHIEQWFMVTDQGWLVTFEEAAEQPVVRLSRRGETRDIPVAHPAETCYDQFVDCIRKGTPNPPGLPTVEEALVDIELIVEPWTHSLG